MKKKLTVVMAAAALLGSLTAGTAAASDDVPAVAVTQEATPTDPSEIAQSDEDRATTQAAYVTNIQVINRALRSSDYIDRTQRLGDCSVGATGATCSVSVGTSATRTIQLSLGITRAAVASSLGISSSATESVSTTCTSPAMTAGQRWVAYPRGQYWSYQVWSQTTLNGQLVSSSTSGTLYAFNPTKNAVYCTYA